MAGSSNTAITMIPITASASVLTPLPRAFRAYGTGTFTYVNQGSDATERTVTIAGAETFQFSPLKITAVSSVTIWGYYGGED